MTSCAIPLIEMKKIMFIAIILTGLLGQAYALASPCDDFYQRSIEKVISTNDYVLLDNPNTSTTKTLILQQISSGKKLGLFKAIDGEPLKIDRVDVEDIYPRAIHTGYIREAAAYWVDQYLGLNIAAPVMMIKVEGKVGALIKWQEGYSDYYSYWQRHYQTYPTEQVEDLVFLLSPEKSFKVQKMAVLDMIIGNWDRNLKNFMINSDRDIMAIDHAMGFPLRTETLFGNINWGWNRGSHGEEILSEELRLLLLNINVDHFLSELQANYSQIELEALELTRQRILILQDSLEKNTDATLSELARKIRFHRISWSRIN